MSNHPNTQEYHEAIQMEANKIREEFKASLSDKDIADMEAVEKAVRIMEEQKVPFILFPILRVEKGVHHNSDNPKYGAWQWNSFCSLMEYGPDDKYTKESIEKNGLWHHCVLYSIFLQVTIQMLNLPKDMPLEEQFIHFTNLFQKAGYENYCYLNDIVPYSNIRPNEEK